MNPESWSLKFVILTALQALTVPLSACDRVLSRSVNGNPLSTIVQHRPTARQKQYGTTIPLQLVEQDWKPFNQRKFQSYPASLQLLIEVEGEKLLLALEKNEGLFASNYTETHYLEDGSAVTGIHNFTANCYYHGKVEGHVNSDVSLSTCAGIKGFISLGGRSYVLEPCADHSDGTHWIYTAEHLSFVPGTCGHDFNTTYSTVHTDSSPFRAFSTRVSGGLGATINPH